MRYIKVNLIILTLSRYIFRDKSELLSLTFITRALILSRLELE
jgi:hypothetical protein